MFAYREVSVEGLGYSPSKLLFGKKVKGILQLIKKSWLREDLLYNVKSTNIIFFLSIRDRIRTSIEIATDMKEKSKKKVKCWYGRKARDASYEVRERVLLLLPLIGNPVQAKNCGRYKVVKRLGKIDYLISTPNRRKSKRMVHVNIVPYIYCLTFCHPSVACCSGVSFCFCTV